METTIAIKETADSRDTLEDISVEGLIDQRVSPGVMVLAPPMRLLHVNEQAWELIRCLNDMEHGNGNGCSKRVRGSLPNSLHQVCSEIFLHLRGFTHVKDWGRLEIRRLIGPPNHPRLIRGFGVPGQNGREHSRVVLLIEAIGRRREVNNQETTARFKFTEREQTIVHYLSKGCTNKEIASALKLALPTVKEHIRHIMEKTKTTTRTGILVRVFRM